MHFHCGKSLLSHNWATLRANWAIDAIDFALGYSIPPSSSDTIVDASRIFPLQEQLVVAAVGSNCDVMNFFPRASHTSCYTTNSGLAAGHPTVAIEPIGSIGRAPIRRECVRRDGVIAEKDSPHDAGGVFGEVACGDKSGSAGVTTGAVAAEYLRTTTGSDSRQG